MMALATNCNDLRIRRHSDGAGRKQSRESKDAIEGANVQHGRLKRQLRHCGCEKNTANGGGEV